MGQKRISGLNSGTSALLPEADNLASYGSEKRAALDLWANHVRVAVAQAAGGSVVKRKASEA
jgi:hypothetical protein